MERTAAREYEKRMERKSNLGREIEKKRRF
jgi:hypothetical protein